MSKENPPPYSPQAPPPGFYPPPNGPPPAQMPQYTAQMPQQTAQMPPHTVVVTQTVAPMILGPHPTALTCPSCHAQIVSSVETEANTKTHLFALLLCLFGCWPCCCIPYCVDSCQSQNHYCPNCKAYLGNFSN